MPFLLDWMVWHDSSAAFYCLNLHNEQEEMDGWMDLMLDQTNNELRLRITRMIMICHGSQSPHNYSLQNDHNVVIVTSSWGEDGDPRVKLH